jgi:hypothetical protein
MWQQFLTLITFAAAHTSCPQILWKNVSYNYKAYQIAANTKTSIVWSISKARQHAQGGAMIAFLDEKNKRWVEDPTQPTGAKQKSDLNLLAVDVKGNPAYIDNQNIIQWKKQGKWR